MLSEIPHEREITAKIHRAETARSTYTLKYGIAVVYLLSDESVKNIFDDHWADFARSKTQVRQF